MESMLAAPVPDNEVERLQSLLAMDIMDTAPERELDQVARLAALAFDVPVALISLIDEKRQWFKACVGLAVSETSRDVSFCGHAIADDITFVVEDAAKDPRFADNPLVTGEPFIRFYAGHPLHSPEGFRIGTLCIIDDAPRRFDADAQARLAALAGWAEAEIHARSERGAGGTVVRAMDRHRFWRLSKDLLCVAGLDGFFKDLSPSFSASLGYSMKDLTDRPFLDFVHPDDVASTMAEMEKLRDGAATLHFRNRYRHRNGRYLWLDWSAVPEGASIYAIARDVTDDVVMEERLDRVIRNLQERSSQLLDFTRIVSHDLRAPLRRMERLENQLPPEAHHELETMEKMIEDLVAYERLALVGVPHEAVDLDQLWAESLDRFRSELADASARAVGPLGRIHGNADEWSVVFRNLIDNSVKYRRDDRPLEIRLQAIQEPDKITLHYMDNGPGIPADRQEAIWEPFRGGDQDGTHGMGLAMLRRIVQRHGGTVRSNPAANGAHFIIEVPPAQEPEPAGDEAARHAVASGQIAAQAPEDPPDGAWEVVN